MGDLHERIAECLGWSPADARSLSLQSLRDLVRPKSPKLAHEIDLLVQSHAIIVGPRRARRRRY